MHSNILKINVLKFTLQCKSKKNKPSVLIQIKKKKLMQSPRFELTSFWVVVDGLFAWATRMVNHNWHEYRYITGIPILSNGVFRIRILTKITQPCKLCDVFPFETAKETEYFLSHTPLNCIQYVKICIFPDNLIIQVKFDIVWWITGNKKWILHDTNWYCRSNKNLIHCDVMVGYKIWYNERGWNQMYQSNFVLQVMLNYFVLFFTDMKEEISDKSVDLFLDLTKISDSSLPEVSLTSLNIWVRLTDLYQR
jgi:hypothetical protein